MTGRTTHTIDASGKSLGRLATEIAVLLRGKHRPTFERHNDAGDFVAVTNAAAIKITGNKTAQKMYYRYSGYPGGLTATKLGDLMVKDPGEALRRAVHGMLPKNKLRPRMIKRLIIKS